MDKEKKILIVCKDKTLNEIISFCLEGWGYEVLTAENEVTVGSIKKTEPDLIIIDLGFDHSRGIELCKELKDDFFTTSVPIIALIKKKNLRSQLLSLEHGIDDYLTKPPDPLDLRVRIEMALRRTQYSFYTNSLTKLAGGRIIEEILKEKIYRKKLFSFAHIDIDNFKYFNDYYGYIRGDEVIVQMAYILYSTIKEFGNKRDFIGHIGGDDFVFISTPEKETLIAKNLIKEFNRLMPYHYSKADRENKYIIARDRSGIERKVPLISLSVAIINNRNVTFKSIIEINEAVTATKSYLKKIPGSKFMVDRRRIHTHTGAKEINDEDLPFFADSQNQPSLKPLGQILLEKKLIDEEMLNLGLQKHWRTGLSLGETLEDMEIIKRADVEKIIKEQNNFLIRF